eukprot:2245880-Alexandrium_andersonii.AAC.1
MRSSALQSLCTGVCESYRIIAGPRKGAKCNDPHHERVGSWPSSQAQAEGASTQRGEPALS